MADVVNNDARVKDAIKVAFLPDYRVSLATLIIPGADLSEQISTAGMEASGTGNMKLAMNGALTIGTWDGANIEIAEEVGLDNIFIFGLRAEEILEMQQKGTYNPRERYDNDPAVKEVMDALASDRFCPNEHGLFRWIFDELVHRGDRYYHIADFPSYVEDAEADRGESTATTKSGGAKPSSMLLASESSPAIEPCWSTLATSGILGHSKSQRHYSTHKNLRNRRWSLPRRSRMERQPSCLRS